MSTESGSPGDERLQEGINPKSRRHRISARVRYAIPVAVILIASAVQMFLWNLRAGDATRQVMSVWFILPTTVMLMVVWWLFLSGFRWKVRLGVAILGGIAVAIFFGLVRVKDFSGAMVPQFESRWEPTAETKAADYWKTLDQSAPSVDTEQHLNSPTPPEAKLAVSPLDWPQFEGPKRDGVARGVHVRSDWRENPPRRMWDHPVGAGWSSFAVVGKYALTQEQRDDDEAVVCYDADTGRQLWAHLDRGARHSTVLGGLGPRATPTVSGSRVYTFGATGILNCLDPESGGLIWSTNAVKEAGVPPVQFGMSGSPLVYDNVVVVNPGGIRTSMADRRESGRAVIAYDRLTGQRIWATGDYQAGYASPILATIGGVRQVIIYDAVGAGGYDAATGNELWRSPEWMNSTYNNIAQPIILPDRSIFLSSGYGTGSILFDAHKSGDLWTVKERWRAPNKFKLKFNTGVYRDGFVYGLDEGILACLDLSNGKLRWKKGRYSYGEVLLLKDLLLVLSEEGDAVLVEISPSGSREVSRFHAISGKTWNHPAISRERLYVRNGEEAACFDLSSQQTAAR